MHDSQPDTDERRIAWLGFWAGFGKAVALGIVLSLLLVLVADTSHVTPFSALGFSVLWATGSAVWASDRYSDARRWYRESLRPKMKVD